MIKVDNLTKLYRAKGEITCRALDGVSTVLPDKGLVFILGKSGSGKSTLLNLIGGLDSFDSGDIVSFGNSLSSFTEEDYEAYRSDFVSFIFQDYHLIDELTVLENITLFSADAVDEELLRTTLDKVGMTDYVDRYPDELSGGQKQRVAIARGIIKNPHIILCDEPTGNLDKHTSLQILELLKKLSRDKLVLIVSHNIVEAETYADRIIELADGKIISDRMRDSDYRDCLIIEEGRATLPYRNRMGNDELERLNSCISDGTVTEIALGRSGFEPADVEYVEDKRDLKLRTLGKDNVRRLFRKFFFSKYKIAISTIILSLLMFGLFSIIQSFIGFDPNAALVRALDEERPMVVISREYSGFPNNIHDDLSELLEGEDAYSLYSQTIWLTSPRSNSWDSISRLSDQTNMEALYIHENYGLLLCDEKYLSDMFGINGEIKLLAGDLEDARTGSGILITDYFAESILYHEKLAELGRYETYEDIVTVNGGIFVPGGSNSACRIVGIIDTDYEEKYKSLFKKHENLVSKGAEGEKQLQKMISGDPAYIKFADDVVMNLGVAYSLNPNYIDSFTLDETTLVRCNGLFFVSASGSVVSGKSLSYMTTLTEGVTHSDFADDEIAIPYKMYNDLFGTDLDDSDANKMLPADKIQTVLVRRHVDNDLKKDVVYEKAFKITAVTSARMVASRNTMLTFKRLDWQPSAYYVKDIKNVDRIVSFIENGNYRFLSRSQRNVQRVNDLVLTFRDLFLFLEITTIFMIAFFLILFGIRSIKQNSYQIGVIKALGGRNRDVQKIFVIKTLIIGVLIAIVSTATSVFFVRAADSVLIASIETVLGMNVSNLEVISFIPRLIALDGLLMILLSCISAFIPVIMLKRIKPVEIIKTKE